MKKHHYFFIAAMISFVLAFVCPILLGVFNNPTLQWGGLAVFAVAFYLCLIIGIILWLVYKYKSK